MVVLRGWYYVVVAGGVNPRDMRAGEDGVEPGPAAGVRRRACSSSDPFPDAGSAWASAIIDPAFSDGASICASSSALPAATASVFTPQVFWVAPALPAVTGDGGTVAAQDCASMRPSSGSA